MIQAPTLKPFSDSKDFMLVRDMVYILGQTDISITVPKGFVTDFASVPKGLWSFGLSPHGKFSKAAIIHDYLYWTQGCSRQQSDGIMLIAMKESKVEAVDQFALYEGLDLAGNPAWVENRQARQAGIPRIVPVEYWDFPPDATWAKYREVLVSKGVKDSIFLKTPSYCGLGNSEEIPGIK
ncbi:MAG: hypothetical protein ACI9LY_002853 [Arenicella sp.]|jgi:hypothetical protein